MSVSVSLNTSGSWLLTAVALGLILLSTFIWLCNSCGRKRAKPKLQAKESNDLFVESLSEIPEIEVSFHKMPLL